MIFKLKRDLIIPVSKEENKGYALFPKQEFVLSYNILEHDFRNESLTIAIDVLRKTDKVSVKQVGCAHFTKEGINAEIALNEKEVTLYNEASQSWQEKMTISQEKSAELLRNLSALETDFGAENDPKKQAAIEKKIITLRAELNKETTAYEALQSELSQLAPVEPIFEKINTYAEVIEYFDNKMNISAEGLKWALIQKLYGTALSQIVEKK